MNNLQKNFVVQLGSLITLYVSVAAFLTLIFSTINIAIPDTADGQWMWDSNQSAMRTSLAILIVFFPVYLILTRVTNIIKRENNALYDAFTKLLVYLSLLIGGLVMMIDLVTVIVTFLEGELTLRFFAKALSLLMVIGAVFYYYLRDVQGYWQLREGMSATYGAVAAAVVFGMILASFYHLEMPAEARERKIDTEVVGILQDAQWRIEEYHQTNETLPENFVAIFGEFSVPETPDDRTPVSYEVTGETTYKLCGEFANDSFKEHNLYNRPMFEKNYNWEYKAGNWCFERVVDGVYKQ